MELLGGLLVLVVVAYLSMSVCATGLCAKEKAAKDAYEAIKDQQARR